MMLAHHRGQGLRLTSLPSVRNAPTDASTIIQNFLKSVGGSRPGQRTPQGNLFTTLAELLTPASTIPLVETADEATVDRFLEFLPPTLLALAQEVDDAASVSVDASSADAAKQALSLNQKKDTLRRVLRSPQFSQSLSSLTIALRDGGLPSISEALHIEVQNGGFMRRGGVPLGGGDAVEAFLNGVKDHVKEEDSGAKGQMDID
jgi:26S proteasome regulatory subunit N13